MDKTKKTSGTKILLYGILWAATYMASLIIVKEFDPAKTLGIILSCIPTLTFIPFIYHFIKGIGEMDEVERRIQLEAAVWAFTLGLLLLMTLGLLDLVVALKKEDWGYRHLVHFFFLFYFVGIIISKRKYS
jgi:hypothetical protein